MDPSYYTVQEADGPVAPLINYDSMTPYSTASACNANSVGTTPPLSAPNTPGGLPVINPACAVVRSYLRTQPTRFLYPTEVFRFQSSSIQNVAMNGDFRYTSAKMHMPAYYENFQGLSKTTRALTYTGMGRAQRKVTAADYGIVWQASPKFSVSDQFGFSNVQEPGSTTMTSLTTVATPTTAGSETMNNPALITTNAAAGASTLGGSGSIGVPLPDFFGQRFITNDVTGTWDGWSRATVSLTYRHRNHVIAEGIPHNTALAPAPPPIGTVTINEDGGILNLALRPTSKWDGTARPKWCTPTTIHPVAPRTAAALPDAHPLPGAVVGDALGAPTTTSNAKTTPTTRESAPLDGPLDHVDHSRVASLGRKSSPTSTTASISTTPTATSTRRPISAISERATP